MCLTRRHHSAKTTIVNKPFPRGERRPHRRHRELGSTLSLANVSDFHRSNVHPSQTAFLGTYNSSRVLLSHEAAQPILLHLGRPHLLAPSLFWPESALKCRLIVPLRCIKPSAEQGRIMRKPVCATAEQSSQTSGSSVELALVPAAQYVRMSDEAQQYSVDNQKAAIAEYAASHGFAIVKT